MVDGGGVGVAVLVLASTLATKKSGRTKAVTWEAWVQRPPSTITGPLAPQRRRTASMESRSGSMDGRMTTGGRATATQRPT